MNIFVYHEMIQSRQ